MAQQYTYWSDFEDARFTQESGGCMDVEAHSTAIEGGGTEDQANGYAAQQLVHPSKPWQGVRGRDFDTATVNPCDLVIARTPDALHPAEDGLRTGEHQLGRQLQQLNSADGHGPLQQRYTYPDPELAVYGYGQTQEFHRATQQHLHDHEPSGNDRGVDWGYNRNKSHTMQSQVSYRYTSRASREGKYGQSKETSYRNPFLSIPHTQAETVSADWVYGNEGIHDSYGMNALATQVSPPLLAESIENSTWTQVSLTAVEASELSTDDVHSSQTRKHPTGVAAEITTANNDTNERTHGTQLPDSYAGRRNPEARKNYPFECAVCRKRFLYTDSAQKHYRRHHGEPVNVIQRYDAPKRPRPGRPRGYNNAKARPRRSQTSSLAGSAPHANSAPASGSQTPGIASSPRLEPFQSQQDESSTFASSPPAADGHPFTADLAGQARQTSVVTMPIVHSSSSPRFLYISLLNSPFDPRPPRSSPPSSLIEQSTNSNGFDRTRLFPPLTPETAPDTAQQALLGFRRTPQPALLTTIERATATSLQNQSSSVATSPSRAQSAHSLLVATRQSSRIQAQRSPLSAIDPNLRLPTRGMRNKLMSAGSMLPLGTYGLEYQTT